MKRILPLIAPLCVFAAAPAFASWSYDGADGNNIWATDGTWRIKFIKNGSTYYIGGWSNGGATLDLSTVYEDLANESTPHTVPFSSVGNQCFQNNKDVETVILPERCTTVGNNAFNGCTALHTATMPGLTTVNQGAFSGCTSLVTVDCPNLKYINSYGAFQSCTSLVELKVSADMTSFSTDTFRSCTSFTTLYTNDDTKVVGHVQLPLGVTSLGNYNFYQTKIVRIDAPSVTSIGGQSAFSGCTSLTEAHFPKLASMSGTAIFNGCSALQTVEISSALSGTIQNQNFNGCTVLKSVYQSGNEPVEGLVDLPAGVTKLEWACFQNCKAIVNVVAPGLVDIQNRAFTSCTALKTAHFSPSLAVLHNNNNSSQAAFYGCSALVDFYPSTIPNLTEMRSGMFQNCSSLTNAFDFSGCTLTDISGGSFFQGAAKVPCVRLPASFPKLYQYEFSGMAPGAEIHFAGDVPAVDNNNHKLWQGTDGAGYRYKIYVDAETFPAWTNATGTFTAKTAAMEAESDYPGVATLGYLNWHSNGKNNWLVQEPFYVDVTFFDDDGTTVLGVAKTLLGETPVWTGATPEKASSAEFSYEFSGWSTDGSTIVDIATLEANAPMSLQAVYAATTRSYTITWKLDSETEIGSETLLYGATPVHADASKPATAEYSYEFLGWSTDGSTVLASIPAVTGDATYIAVFKQHDAATTATISWFDEDGSTPLDPATTTVAKGVQPTHAEPAKASTIDTDFTFDGWVEIGGDGTVIATAALPAASGDVSYKAHFASSVRKYTVTFANWDGTVISATAYDYGTAAGSIAVPSDPTRAADAEYTYTFAGWNSEVTQVSGDATYTATYTATANEYNATFVDGIDESVISGPTTYAFGAAVTAPAAPEHKGYTFAAWSPEVGTMPSADTTYTATYTPNKYTITWVNGDSTTTAKYDYHTEVSAITVPAGSKTSTPKASYTFVEWSPAIETVESNTTYTATFTMNILSPMTIALDSAAYDKGTGEATVVTKVGNTDAAATTTAEATAQFRTASVTGESTVDGKTVTSVFDNFATGRGYEWTITATQTYGAEYSGASESASIKGRTYARAAKSWFDNAAVAWNEGAFAPAAQSGSGAQVRLHSTVTFPAILPRVLPDAGAAVVGITAYQPNAGVAPRYYAWNGSQWVKLVGVAPKGGVAVNLLGVVDFARKDGPAVAWYADGFQLTTEDGDWEVPLAGGTKLTSFGLVGDLSVDSLLGDYDIGGVGFRLLVR